MAITASPIISAESAATESELWALASLLRADWSSPVRTRTSWMTDVAAAKSQSEQRRGLIGKPMRMSEAAIHSLTAAEALQIQSTSARKGKARSLCPLYSDQTYTSAPSSGTTINCVTSFRRLFVGGRVVIQNQVDDTFEVRTISAISSTTLTLSTALTNSYPLKSLVLPLIEGRVLLEQSLQIKTDQILEGTISGMELPGVWTLEPTSAPGSVPATFSTYNDYPILDIGMDFRRAGSVSFKRTGSYSNVGVTQEVVAYGSRSRIGRSLPLTFMSREAAWKYIQLFDSRAGRLFPFWVPSPTSDYQLVSFISGGIKVKANGPEIDWEDRPYICIVRADGTVQVRTITAHSRLGAEDTLTLDSSFTSTTTTERVCMAHLTRFDSDESVESWITDEACEVDAPIIEVLDEKEKEIANLNAIEVNPMTIGFDPSFDGGDSGVNAPMYYWPCRSANERPVVRAANLTLPLSFRLSILNEFTVDEGFSVTSGQVSAQMIEAVTHTFRMEYEGALATGNSRHWHHNVLYGGVWDLRTNDGSAGVVKHRWRATKTYLDASDIEQMLTVDMIVEWSPFVAMDPFPGAAGALLNFYVYSTEVNPAFVDGGTYGGIVFDKRDPAVWAGSAKKCHPHMVICASVPTTFTAPCGSRGLGCNEDATRDSFLECVPVPNGAPWVGNDPSISENNIVYSPPDSSTPRAMSLGGNCPASEFFDHLIIENGDADGLTALVPSRPGWNSETGELDVLNGVSMTLETCLPEQDEISCCGGLPGFKLHDVGGSPDCWRAPTGSQEPCESGASGYVCCFDTKSWIELEINQLCFKCVRRYDEDCVLISPAGDFLLGAMKQRTLLLKPCNTSLVSHASDDSTRIFEWETFVFDPLAEDHSITDTFEDGTNWSVVAGSWVLASNAALVTAGSGADVFNAEIVLSGWSSYINGSAAVSMYSDNVQGLIWRTQSSNQQGYAAVANASAGWLRIYKLDGVGGSTVLAEKTGLTIALPYRLTLTVSGSNFTASIDGDTAKTIQASDCDYGFDGSGSGYVGLIGTRTSTNLDFRNFVLVDANSVNYVRISVFYDVNGWSLVVPQQGMPYYPKDETGCADVNPDCGVFPECGCTKISTFPTPPTLITGQATAAGFAWQYLNKGKPYEGFGGPGGGSAACCGALPLAPFRDFVAARIRVIPDPDASSDLKPCSEIACPPGVESWCQGAAVWYGELKTCP